MTMFFASVNLLLIAYSKSFKLHFKTILFDHKLAFPERYGR